MTNGNDILEFEEQHHEELAWGFIKENKEKYDEFVEREYSEHNGGLV